LNRIISVSKLSLFRKSSVVILSMVFFLTTMSESIASECWNRGIYNSKKDSKLGKAQVVFNYDENYIDYKIKFNGRPSNKLQVTIGGGDTFGDCVSVSAIWIFKGYGDKKPKRDTTLTGGYTTDMLETISKINWKNNTLSFRYNIAPLYNPIEDVMTDSCVLVETIRYTTSYQNDTICTQTGNILTCQNPGYVSGYSRVKSLTIWANGKNNNVSPFSQCNWRT
jgi:hypothetical protein